MQDSREQVGLEAGQYGCGQEAGAVSRKRGGCLKGMGGLPEGHGE